MLIYAIFADSNGRMTTARGILELNIFGTETKNKDLLLFTKRYSVLPENFLKTNVGLGAFAHEVILVNIGRIPYGNFSHSPEKSSRVRVQLLFKSSSDTRTTATTPSATGFVSSLTSEEHFNL